MKKIFKTGLSIMRGMIESMEKFILVSKINKENKVDLEYLYNFLKEENIKYKEKIEEEWVGIKQPKYEQNIAIYVSENDEEKVRKFLNDLDNAIMQNDEYNELKEYTNDENAEDEKELRRYQKRQKRLIRIMVSTLFIIVVFCFVITIIKGLN